MNQKCQLKTYQQNQDSKNNQILQKKPLCKKHKNAQQFVKISVNEEVKQNFYVHELVAKHFVPNPDNLPYVEHIDGNRLNNNANNLRWTATKPKGYKPIN